MFVKNREKYFENRKEQIEYEKVFQFIISFYKDKKDLENLLNNIRYLKTNQEQKSYVCFIKEIQSILYLFTLEYPSLAYLYKEYKKNKENNILSFAIMFSFCYIRKMCQSYGLIK